MARLAEQHDVVLLGNGLSRHPSTMAFVKKLLSSTTGARKWVLDADGLDEAMHPMMLDLVRWHGAEEVEHRCVAFDVYQHLGGGYPSSNRLKPAWDAPGRRAEASNLGSFAEAILGPLGRAKEAFGGRPTLILEPGRAVVDAAVFLASRVVAVKEVPEQGPAVVIDAGVNVLPTAYWYDHPIEALDDESGGGAGKVRPTRVYGPLCMQIDVVRDRAPLPPLKVGAPLVIANVGAYCVSQSMQFIQPRPAVVLLGPGEPEVVRRRETWRDIFALDHVPERLRRDGYAL